MGHTLNDRKKTNGVDVRIVNVPFVRFPRWAFTAVHITIVRRTAFSGGSTHSSAALSMFNGTVGG